MNSSLIPTGDAELDRARDEALGSPTDAHTLTAHMNVLYVWLGLLQRQGADTDPVIPAQKRYLAGLEDSNDTEVFAAIDDGLRFCEQIQQSINDDAPKSVPSGERTVSGDVAPVDWPMYGGNTQHTAWTEDAGPVEGTLAWKRPMELGWYPGPAVADGRLYVASPGKRTVAYCLDPVSGDVIWKTSRRPLFAGDEALAHDNHCAATTPLVLEDVVVINEIGAQGSDLGARDLLYMRKTDGKLLRVVRAGTLDYRAGHATLTGDEDLLVYTDSAQKIQDTPPHMVGTSTIVWKDTQSGEPIWDFYIGPTFAEPVLHAGRVYIGTADGTFFCLNVRAEIGQSHVAGGGVSPQRRVVWQHNANGGVNSRALVKGDRVYFGGNDGVVRCLDAGTGKAVWTRELGPTEPRAFKLFSTPELAEDRLYVGSANRHLYCLDAVSGEVIWEHRTDEWIRGKPVRRGDAIYLATIDGTLQCLQESGDTVTQRWSTKLGTHPILSDPVEDGGRVFVTSTDLFLWCLDGTDGTVLWRHSLLECIYRDGERIMADEVAAVAGGHYQSKPTAADGKVFYGTPGRFVYAVDYSTGTELWRYELGAAVSGSPTYSNGRVFVGQQGGEEHFYCLDADDGMPVWKQALGWVWSSATPSEGRLYVPGVDGYVSCLREEDGAILWRYRTGRAAHPEPPVDRGRVYFGSWDHYDYALDAEDGRVVWQVFTGGSPDSGAPIAYDGRLYLPMGGESFRCMDAETGEVIWEHSEEGRSYNASPALHDGRVFISTQLRDRVFRLSAQIICLDAETGEEIWRHAGGGLTAAALAGGKAYFPSTVDPFFYCVDETGNGDGTTTCLWKYRMGDRVYESVPPIYGGMTYICNRDGFFYALK